MTQHPTSKAITPELKKAVDYYKSESVLNFVVNLTAFVDKVCTLALRAYVERYNLMINVDELFFSASLHHGILMRFDGSSP